MLQVIRKSPSGCAAHLFKAGSRLVLSHRTELTQVIAPDQEKAENLLPDQPCHRYAAVAQAAHARLAATPAGTNRWLISARWRLQHIGEQQRRLFAPTQSYLPGGQQGCWGIEEDKPRRPSKPRALTRWPTHPWASKSAAPARKTCDGRSCAHAGRHRHPLLWPHAVASAARSEGKTSCSLPHLLQDCTQAMPAQAASPVQCLGNRNKVHRLRRQDAAQVLCRCVDVPHVRTLQGRSMAKHGGVPTMANSKPARRFRGMRPAQCRAGGAALA